MKNLNYRVGECVGYVEVYPVDEPEKFQFTFMDRTYVADDQYCINPHCKCNEVILTIIDVERYEAGLPSYLILRVSLASGKYRVELDDGFSDHEIAQIYRAYLRHIGGDLGLFRRHYQQMKEFGRQYFRQMAEPRRNAPTVTAEKVGRNDPCPCGSGKKYKKCCGA